MSTLTTAPVQSNRQSRRFRIPSLTQIGLYVGLFLLALVVGFPFYWMLVLSITPEADIYRWPLQLFPDSPTLENYRLLFARPDLQIPRWFVNSLLIASLETALGIFVCSLAAYGFARLEFPLRDKMF